MDVRKKGIITTNSRNQKKSSWILVEKSRQVRVTWWKCITTWADTGKETLDPTNWDLSL